MTGIVKSAGSKSMPKSNGATYVLMSVLVTDGKAKGLTVLATRTTSTKDNVVKSTPEIGEEVTLYHTVVPSTREGEVNQHFFEISVGLASATNAELDAAFN